MKKYLLILLTLMILPILTSCYDNEKRNLAIGTIAILSIGGLYYWYNQQVPVTSSTIPNPLPKQNKEELDQSSQQSNLEENTIKTRKPKNCGAEANIATKIPLAQKTTPIPSIAIKKNHDFAQKLYDQFNKANVYEILKQDLDIIAG